MYLDFDVRVDVVAESGNSGVSSAGLMFWSGSGGAYYFLITPKGQFFVLRFASGKFNTVLGTQETPLLKQGIGETNRIGVIAGSGAVRLLINGYQVAQFPAPATLPGQFIGLRASASRKSAGDFGFARFRVRAPAAGTPPVAAVAAQGAPRFSDEFATLKPIWGAPTSRKFVRDGHLILIATPASSSGTAYPFSPTGTPAEISAEAVPPGPNTGATGLVFWSDAKGNGYCLIADSNAFEVARDANGNASLAIAWSPIPRRKPGGTPYRIAVAELPDQAVILISGEVVGRVADRARFPEIIPEWSVSAPTPAPGR